MSSTRLCESIDTLSMAYLDDELAVEERRELDLHMLECGACRTQLDNEREELSLVRKALAVPPAPAEVRERIASALARSIDADEVTRAREAREARRSRLSRFMLPGAAMIAAAASLAVFVAMQPSGETRATAIAHEALRQQTKALPLEVQGVGTAPWLRQHFAPTVTLPRFEDSVALVGARLTAVNGHDAAQLQYEIHIGSGSIGLSAVVIRDIQPAQLGGGDDIVVGAPGRQLMLHVIDIDGVPAVTYVDDNHTGYVFMSGQLSAREVVRLVVASNLIDRAQDLR
ncbi:MAG: zf-HC2 domain-containing protein [Proteobacteria bacterium]|nr:zf-HC2 domain-containing protein [Pseudomonadota bacterium]